MITYLPAAYPEYKPEIQGLLFIGLILGTLVSEVLFSGALGDVIMLKFAQRNGGVRLAECRLWLIYPAVLISAGTLEDTLWHTEWILTIPLVGLTLWGISIDKHYHWIVGQIAFFLCKQAPQAPASLDISLSNADDVIVAAGVQMGNTAICAYVVDCYPRHAMSVITFYSVLLNLSAFVNPVSVSPQMVMSS